MIIKNFTNTSKFSDVFLGANVMFYFWYCKYLMELLIFSLNLMYLYWTLIWLILVSNYFNLTSISTSWHDVIGIMAWCCQNHGMMLMISWH